jgi:hypothetical protein
MLFIPPIFTNINYTFKSKLWLNVRYQSILWSEIRRFLSISINGYSSMTCNDLIASAISFSS